MTEPRVWVDVIHGQYHGERLRLPASEAKTLVGTGQARYAIETPEAARPKVETPEQPAARPLDTLTKEELVELADARGVDVVRQDGEEGAPLKSDYLAALAD